MIHVSCVYVFSMKTSVYKGFSMAVLNNKMVNGGFEMFIDFLSLMNIHERSFEIFVDAL